jgi:hypothetical protein
VRDRGLVERQRAREVADADLVFGAGEGREHGQPMGVAEGLEETGFVRPIRLIDVGRLAAPLYWHISILGFISAFVNIVETADF